MAVWHSRNWRNKPGYPIPPKTWPASPAYKLVNFLSASHNLPLENLGSSLPMVPSASLRKQNRDKWKTVLWLLFSCWELMSPYHSPNDMNEYSCFVWWEERTIRKLAKGDKGWKPNRTATKSLGRWNSFSAVAPLQFLLMLGCRGRQERFIRSVPLRKRLGKMLQKLLSPCKEKWTQKRVRGFQAISWWAFYQVPLDGGLKK